MIGVKKILSCMLIFAALIGMSAIGFADDNPDNPSGAIVDNGSSATGEKYSVQEFDALSDQEKRDVYFNHPDLLPDNFESYKYKDIMHPEQE